MLARPKRAIAGQVFLCATLLVTLLAGCNRSPTADIQAIATVLRGNTTTLDGSASSDPDHDTLTYTWKQMAGTPVQLSGANSATASFIAPHEPGVLTFQLTVTDARKATDSKTVDITVIGEDRQEAPTAALSSLTLNPAQVVGGAAATGTVTVAYSGAGQTQNAVQVQAQQRQALGCQRALVRIRPSRRRQRGLPGHNILDGCQ